MRLRTALLATTLLAAAPVVAKAQPITGPYVSVGAGYNYQQPIHSDFSPTTYANGVNSTAGSRSKYRFGDGFNGVGSLGWGFGNGFRAELQGDYYYNSVDHRSGTATPGSTGGKQETYGAMANILYDFNPSQFGFLPSPVVPYLGIGAGYQWTHLTTQTNYNNGFNSRVGGTNGSFAYQGIAGVAFNIAQVPGLAVTVEYRFLGTLNQDAYQSTAITSNGLHKGNADFGKQYNHSGMLGLRYAFDTAPPPPPQHPFLFIDTSTTDILTEIW